MPGIINIVKLPWLEELKTLEGTSIAIFLNACDVLLYAKYIFLYLKITIALTIHHICFFLKKVEVVTKFQS